MRREAGSGVGIAVTVAVLLGLAPVLYCLSLGPAVLLANSGLLAVETAEAFYTPLFLLADSWEPAETVLRVYVELWDSPAAAATLPANCPLPTSVPLPPPAPSY